MLNNDWVTDNIVLAFVDTSVLDPMYNDYRNLEDHFMALKKHVEANKLMLFTHEIVIKEMENHIMEEITKRIDKIEEIQNTKEFVLLRSINEYEFLFRNLEKERIINDTIRTLKKKLKEIGFIVLKTGNVSVKNLMEDYFDSNPPFGIKGKKSEFPDAIMLQSLIKFVGDQDKIHVVAKDGDWERVGNVCKNVIIHKKIASLLDYINKDNIVSSAIKTYLNKSSTGEFVAQQIKGIIENIEFDVDGTTYDWGAGTVSGYSYEDTELIEVNDISYTVDTIDDITCSCDADDGKIEAIVTVRGGANVKLTCIYFDEENSVWDSEKREYRYQEYGRINEVHEFLFPLRITITGDYKKELNVDNCKLIQTEELTLLNQVTLRNRQYIPKSYGDEFHVIRRFACPYCENEITVDLISGDTECVGATERQMGAEYEYNVDVNGWCPICNSEYQVTGEIWEYPVNCLNYEQDVEIKKVP